MAAPVLQAHTARRGALTRQNAGAVDLSQFMVASGTGITSWAITLTGGTSGHWNLPTDGTFPTPTSAGQTAVLNGGPYTFSVTATNGDGTSDPATLTINIAANTYTVSAPTQITSTNANIGIRNTALRTALGGKVIEIARGSDWSTGEVTFKGFNLHTAGERFTLKSEDVNNPSVIRNILCDGVQRLDIQNLDLSYYLPGNASAGSQQNTRFIRIVGTSTDTFGLSGSIHIDNINASAPEGTTVNEWVTGVYVSGTSTENIDDIEITNSTFVRVYSGSVMSNVTNVTQSNLVVDQWTGAGTFFSSNFSNILQEDIIVCRPYENPIDTGDHQDFNQWGSVNTSQNVTGITQRRLMYLVASPATGASATVDGTVAEGTQCPQGPFYNDVSYWGGVETGLTVNDVTMDGIFCDTAAVNGLTMESGTGWNVQRVSLPRGQANFAAYTGTSKVGAVKHPSAAGVLANNVFHLPSTSDNTGLTTSFAAYANDNIVMEEAETAPGTWTEAARIAFLSTWFDDPGAVIDFKNLTAAQIAAATKLAYAPILNGPLKNADGTYQGSFFPDGSWNDGTVYLATPPTTYTITAPVNTVAVGEPVTVTMQLDAEANVDVAINPSVSGVSGTFTPDPLTIVTGQGQGSVVFIASTAGTATISATNDRGYTDPSNLVLTITAAGTAPTVYTQTLSAGTYSAFPNAIFVTYVLDAAASEAVTITPACTLAGSFTSGATVVIPFGQTTGTATFVPSAIGLATFSATNGSSLSNPSTAATTVTGCNVGQLLVLGLF